MDGMPMLEQRLNEIFGDNDPTGFGTGWWSGVLSAFFGLLAFGAVICLHFPQLLSSPELRPFYPMHLIRLLIQAVILGAIFFGVVSAMLRKKKVLALTGMLFALGATLLGGASVPINQDLHNGPAIGLDWFLLDDPMHRGVQTLVRDLNGAYRTNPALHVHDAQPEGFSWVVMDDAGQSVFAYLRLGGPDDPPVLAVCNFTPVPRLNYRLGVPIEGVWREIVNTDASIYGGSGLGNDGQVIAENISLHGQPASVSLTLPPLATLILRAGT